MRLQGKVVIVTGGASGIGEAMVRRFCTEGADVVSTDVDSAGASIGEQTGALFRQHDVADEASWVALMSEVTERFGRLDALMNNAGIISDQSIEQADLATWNRVMAVNVTGPMLGCREAIKAMRENPGGSSGSIVNTASTTSFLGLANDAVYTTSKSAIVGLTRSVATYCATERLDIRCNSLHPGTTYTAILRGHVERDPSLYAVFEAMSPTGRMGHPDEVANMALYLASDESRYSTGAQFVVDGGLVNAHPTM